MLTVEHRQLAEGGKGQADPAEEPQTVEGSGVIPLEMNEQDQQGEADGRLKESNALEALIRHHSGSSLAVKVKLAEDGN